MMNQTARDNSPHKQYSKIEYPFSIKNLKEVASLEKLDIIHSNNQYLPNVKNT